jgi:hypothetical protein
MRETKSDETKPISGEAEPTEDMANTEVMDESVVSVADAETEGPALDRAAQPGSCQRVSTREHEFHSVLSPQPCSASPVTEKG